MKIRATLPALLLLAGCDAGQISIEFIWPGDRPTFPAEQPVTTFLRVEERIELLSPGRVLVAAEPQPFSEPKIEIPAIPYGENRVIVVEARESREPDSQVLYYGLSEKFSLNRGENLQIAVFMQPTPPPEPLPPELGGSIRVVTSTRAPGYVAGPDVELVLTPGSAEYVRLSNVVGLPENESVTLKIAALDPSHRTPWNLDRGLRTPCRSNNSCARQVFAKFIDARGYASRPVSTEVVIDSAPPAIVAGATAVSPKIANADSVLVVSLTASEVLRKPPQVVVAGFEHFPLRKVYPETDEPSSNYTFTAAAPASALGADGEFTILATLEDLVGNISSNLAGGTFRVDTPAPGLSSLTIDPPRIDDTPGRQITIRFELDEALRTQVSVGGRPVDDCRELGAQEIFCTLAIRGDEIPAGTESIEAVLVEAFDAADNVARLSGTIVFDFRLPLVRSATFNPAIAREGITASLTISSDEPLADGSIPELRGTATGWAFFGTSGLDYTFQRSIDAALAEGDYDLSEVVLTDRAGNISTIALQPPAIFTVDKTPPQISDLTVEPARAGYGTSLTIHFRLAEDPARGTLAVTLGGRPITNCTPAGLSYTCTHAISGNEIPAGSEANQAVVVDVADAAGNAARSSANVIVDFRAPDLAGASISPAIAREGSLIFLTMTSDEPLAFGTVPVLEWKYGADPGLIFIETIGLTHSFSAIAGAGTADGEYSLDAVGLEDQAGNSARIALSPALSFVVDKIPPRISSFVVSPARIGRSGTITARFVLAESVGAGTLSVTLGGRSMSCSQSGAPPAIDVVCTRVVAGDEIPDGAEASQSVAADVTDAAGNSARASAIVIFDFRAPGITAVSFSPAIAREGSIVSTPSPPTKCSPPRLGRRWNGPADPIPDSLFNRRSA